MDNNQDLYETYLCYPNDNSYILASVNLPYVDKNNIAGYLIYNKVGEELPFDTHYKHIKSNQIYRIKK